MKKKIINILIVGVGGQGVMTLGKIIQEYGMLDPEILDVVASESRGVSQREGSVFSAAKFIYRSQTSENKSYVSFDIPLHGADLIIGLEPLEFYRNLKFLKQDSHVILNSHQILPKSLLLSNQIDKQENYPISNRVMELIRKFYPNLKLLMKNFTNIALEESGNSINANKLVLNELSNHFPEIFKEKIMKKIIKTELR